MGWDGGGGDLCDAVQPVTSHLRHFPAAKCTFYSSLRGSLHTAATAAHFTFWCPLPAGRGVCVCVCVRVCVCVDGLGPWGGAGWPELMELVT